jgi:hypothetical protein
VFVWAPLHNKKSADWDDDSDSEDGSESGASDDDEEADMKVRRYGVEVMKACPSLRLFIGMRTVKMNMGIERHKVKGIHPYTLDEYGFGDVRVSEDEFRYIDPDNPCKFPLRGEKFECRNLPEECDHLCTALHQDSHKLQYAP